MQSPRAEQPIFAPVTVIGSGRVGNALARALVAAGREVRMVGRDESPAVDPSSIVLLCVPDDQIGEACATVASLPAPPEFVGHTSGATGLDVLAPLSELGAEAFSLHPLQTVPDGDADLTGAPAAIAGMTPLAVARARELAEACQMVPFEVPEDSRAAYHAAAAMASNFLIALEASAEELLEAAGIEGGHDLLIPLVLRTAANWAEHGSSALTGPIARGDEATIRRHLDAIERLAPELADAYEALAERTRAVAATGGRA